MSDFIHLLQEADLDEDDSHTQVFAKLIKVPEAREALLKALQGDLPKSRPPPDRTQVLMQNMAECMIAFNQAKESSAIMRRRLSGVSKELKMAKKECREFEHQLVVAKTQLALDAENAETLKQSNRKLRRMSMGMAAPVAPMTPVTPVTSVVQVKTIIDPALVHSNDRLKALLHSMVERVNLYKRTSVRLRAETGRLEKTLMSRLKQGERKAIQLSEELHEQNRKLDDVEVRSKYQEAEIERVQSTKQVLKERYLRAVKANAKLSQSIAQLHKMLVENRKKPAEQKSNTNDLLCERLKDLVLEHSRLKEGHAKLGQRVSEATATWQARFDSQLKDHEARLIKVKSQVPKVDFSRVNNKLTSLTQLVTRFSKQAKESRSLTAFQLAKIKEKSEERAQRHHQAMAQLTAQHHEKIEAMKLFIRNCEIERDRTKLDLEKSNAQIKRLSAGESDYRKSFNEKDAALLQHKVAIGDLINHYKHTNNELKVVRGELEDIRAKNIEQKARRSAADTLKSKKLAYKCIEMQKKIDSFKDDLSEQRAKLMEWSKTRVAKNSVESSMVEELTKEGEKRDTRLRKLNSLISTLALMVDTQRHDPIMEKHFARVIKADKDKKMELVALKLRKSRLEVELAKRMETIRNLEKDSKEKSSSAEDVGKERLLEAHKQLGLTNSRVKKLQNSMSKVILQVNSIKNECKHKLLLEKSSLERLSSSLMKSRKQNDELKKFVQRVTSSLNESRVETADLKKSDADHREQKEKLEEKIRALERTLKRTEANYEDVLKESNKKVDRENLIESHKCWKAMNDHLTGLKQILTSQIIPRIEETSARSRQKSEVERTLVQKLSAKLSMNTEQVKAMQGFIDRVANKLAVIRRDSEKLKLQSSKNKNELEEKIKSLTKALQRTSIDYEDTLKESKSMVNREDMIQAHNQIKIMNDRIRSLQLTVERKILPQIEIAKKAKKPSVPLEVIFKMQENLYELRNAQFKSRNVMESCMITQKVRLNEAQLKIDVLQAKREAETAQTKFAIEKGKVLAEKWKDCLFFATQRFDTALGRIKSSNRMAQVRLENLLDKQRQATRSAIEKSGSIKSHFTNCLQSQAEALQRFSAEHANIISVRQAETTQLKMLIVRLVEEVKKFIQSEKKSKRAIRRRSKMSQTELEAELDEVTRAHHRTLKRLADQMVALTAFSKAAQSAMQEKLKQAHENDSQKLAAVDAEKVALENKVASQKAIIDRSHEILIGCLRKIKDQQAANEIMKGQESLVVDSLQRANSVLLQLNESNKELRKMKPVQVRNDDLLKESLEKLQDDQSKIRLVRDELRQLRLLVADRVPKDQVTKVRSLLSEIVIKMKNQLEGSASIKEQSDKILSTQRLKIAELQSKLIEAKEGHKEMIRRTCNQFGRLKTAIQARQFKTILERKALCTRIAALHTSVHSAAGSNAALKDRLMSLALRLENQGVELDRSKGIVSVLQMREAATLAVCHEEVEGMAERLSGAIDQIRKQSVVQSQSYQVIEALKARYSKSQTEKACLAAAITSLVGAVDRAISTSLEARRIADEKALHCKLERLDLKVEVNGLQDEVKALKKQVKSPKPKSIDPERLMQLQLTVGTLLNKYKSKSTQLVQMQRHKQAISQLIPQLVSLTRQNLQQQAMRPPVQIQLDPKNETVQMIIEDLANELAETQEELGQALALLQVKLEEDRVVRVGNRVAKNELEGLQGLNQLERSRSTVPF